MDARFISNKYGLLLSLTILWVLGVVAEQTQAAGARTQNFLVDAPTAQLARTVSEAAEKYRHDLAVYWLGHELPPWPTPCPIRVIAGDQLAAQGVTTYNRAPVRDFQMEVVGTPERILDSVLPHEVTHTVLATHFGRPLPRWADEGICTTVEHPSEKNKHEAKLREFLNSRRGIAMNKLFLLTEYPSDVLPMYAQGYSVCRFLIEQKDAPTFIEFLTDYMQRPSWTENIRKHYGYESLAELQNYWLAWVSSGSGPVGKFAKVDRSANPNTSQVSLASGELPSNQPPRKSPPVASLPRAQGKPMKMEQLAAISPPGRLESRPNANSTPPPNPRNIGTSKTRGNIGARTPGSRNSGSRNSGAMNAIRPAETTLAGHSDDGWYQRQKQGVHEQWDGLAASTSPDAHLNSLTPRKPVPAVTPIMPPSVRKSGHYSVSQPQPEMQMSRGGWSSGPNFR